MDLGTYESLAYSGPLLVLAGGALFLWLAGLAERRSEALGAAALVLAAFSVFLAARLPEWGEGWSFHRALVVDPFAVALEMLTGLAAAAAIFLATESRGASRARPEDHAFVLSAALGLALVALAANLLTLFLAVELVCVSFSVVARGVLGPGAMLRLLVHGAAASATLLYGMSWIYGLTGAVEWNRVQESLLKLAPLELGALTIATVLVLGSLAFKLLAVPFHLTAAPTPPAAVLSLVDLGSKLALLAIAVRLLFTATAAPEPGESGAWTPVGGAPWPEVVLTLALALMAAGSLAAIRERRLKRILTWLALAHSGNVLAGVALLSDAGLAAALAHLVTYGVASVGALTLVVAVSDKAGGDDLERYVGLATRSGRFAAGALAVFLFSLVGLPPFAGFASKEDLLHAALDRGFGDLVLFGVAASAFQLVPVARFVRASFTRPAVSQAPEPMTLASRVVTGALAGMTVALGVWWTPLDDWALRSIHFFRG